MTSLSVAAIQSSLQHLRRGAASVVSLSINVYKSAQPCPGAPTIAYQHTALSKPSPQASSQHTPRFPTLEKSARFPNRQGVPIAHRSHSHATASRSVLLPHSIWLSSQADRASYVSKQSRVSPVWLIWHFSVPKGEERVRICLHANNTAEEIDGLIATVNRWSREQSSMPQSATSSSLQAKL